MKKNIQNIIILVLAFLFLSMGTILAYQHFVKTSTTKITYQKEIIESPYDEMMREHCKTMPEMRGCEKYNNTNNSENSYSQANTSSLMQPENGEKAATDTKIVELKDGDTYKMEITKVEKKIGNNTVSMLAYNGSIPGPSLKVKQGSKVTINFTNKVKDLATTLHSHGLRLDNLMDGVPNSMMGRQKEIGYGETFSYKLSFPDIGVFWYHPHIREDLQQDLGLYGNYIVEPNTTNYYSKVNREETLVLDDILIENGKIAPISDDYANYVLMGKYGNTMLINGNSDYNLKAKKHESIRMYFTNVSNTRVYDLAIPGAKMKLVGGDNGAYEKEGFVDSLIIAPAERYIVDVYFPDSGNFEILNKNPFSTIVLGKISVSDELISKSYENEFNSLKTNESVVSDIEKFRKYFDKPIDKSISFSLGMKGMRGMGDMGMMGGMETDSHDGIEWEDTMTRMNRNSNSDRMEWKITDDFTQKENMDIDWKFKVGDVEKIKIYNDPNTMHPMQHPFHMHGQRFLVISRDGVKQTNLVWKDTVLVKKGETVEILLDVTNPGAWMAHCHIAEHLSSGMMMHYIVEK